MAAGFIFFVWKLKKSGTRTPWNSRRWFLVIEKIELIDTGRLTEKFEKEMLHIYPCFYGGSDRGIQSGSTDRAASEVCGL